jgi:hypothetical protein
MVCCKLSHSFMVQAIMGKKMTVAFIFPNEDDHIGFYCENLKYCQVVGICFVFGY